MMLLSSILDQQMEPCGEMNILIEDNEYWRGTCLLGFRWKCGSQDQVSSQKMEIPALSGFLPLSETLLWFLLETILNP